ALHLVETARTRTKRKSTALLGRAKQVVKSFRALAKRGMRRHRIDGGVGGQLLTLADVTTSRIDALRAAQRTGGPSACRASRTNAASIRPSCGLASPRHGPIWPSKRLIRLSATCPGHGGCSSPDDGPTTGLPPLGPDPVPFPRGGRGRGALPSARRER